VNDRPSELLDAYQLVAALIGHDVDFVVIGGVALQAHGHVRTTLDLDIVAAWTPENIRRLAPALRELDAKLRRVDADLLGLDLSDPETLLGRGNFLMHTRHGTRDVLAIVPLARRRARYRLSCSGATQKRPDQLIRARQSGPRAFPSLLVRRGQG
jgi:hypothetical protein